MKERGKLGESEIRKRVERDYDKGGTPIFDRNRSYTYTQAAEFLGVSVRTVMREVKANRLVAHKVRGCTRIQGADFLAYMQEGKCS